MITDTLYSKNLRMARWGYSILRLTRQLGLLAWLTLYVIPRPILDKISLLNDMP
jgi:hypothetical protein